MALLLGLLAACSTTPALPPLALQTAVPADAVVPTPTPTQTADVTAIATPAPTASPPVAPGPVRTIQHTVNDEAEVVVDVVEGDRAFLLTVSSPDPSELVGVRQVLDPTGDVRYRANLRATVLIVDELHPKVLADTGAVALFVTSDPGQALVPGQWRVTVTTNGPTADVAVAVTRGDPEAQRRMDVLVWVTADVDPASIEPAWRPAMDAVLAPHGLSIGAMDVVAAGEAGAAHRVIGVAGLADEGHAACTAASAATGTSTAAVVVLADTIGEGVLSASAGRPAPAGLAYRRPDGAISGFAVASPGTAVVGPASHGCVLVAAGERAADHGLVALHELIHVAGLTAHTTERDGLAFDRIDDTPECPRATHDSDGDLRVSATECVGAGADNLLFWAEGGHLLSPAQAWRVRWHPLFQPAGQG